ncbi:MAG: HAMP domain-containing histidine kinase [Bacteroides sp.]|nr:HAMP domain-containing histidine kinase [Bacteroides sp.]
MKYSVAVKFIAIILCAISLVVCVGGALGIVANESCGLYTGDTSKWLENELENVGLNIAWSYATLYNAEHLGGCTGEVLEELRRMYESATMKHDEGWSVTLARDGNVVAEGDSTMEGALSLTYTISPVCPTLVTGEPVSMETGTEDALQPTDSAKASPAYTETIFVFDSELGYDYPVELAFYAGPEYQAVVYLQPAVVDSFMVSFISLIYQLRYHFIGALILGLLAFSATLVYLCCAAGRHTDSKDVYPVALNRLPLDLYALAGGLLEAVLFWLLFEMIDACVSYGGNWAVASLIGLGAFAMALIVVAFLFACSAQMKTKGGFWWRRTIIGWVVVKIGRALRWAGRGCRSLFLMLPLIWQWLLAAVLMAVCPVVSFIAAATSWDGFWVFFWLMMCICFILGDIFIIARWAFCLGQLQKGVAIMSQGGLHYQIPTRHMTGKFRDFANAINSMAGAARIAAERQLKSERMKTELITNVSHDIKTPLTSIINYVDLLKKPHDDQQKQQYLEVLDRQSLRLKKLIDDLMEMSKASTGNIAVEMGQVDAVEAINQALGEFSDKLAASDLDPVFRCPAGPVMIRADGKLLWRVMSNLLSNAVKYAMPGTRLYLDLLVIQGNAVLNMKNISRDQLNVNADELMERFVRGDASRNTEGSGLGLNIAKSLVELQKGQMHLMVDGDLFKVTLVFPLT